MATGGLGVGNGICDGTGATGVADGDGCGVTVAAVCEPGAVADASAVGVPGAAVLTALPVQPATTASTATAVTRHAANRARRGRVVN